MTWESAAIIWLCALNTLLLVTLVMRPAPRAVPDAPVAKSEKRSDGRVPLTDPDPYKAAPEPKDNGSVILMTQERDARLLDGQDE